VALGGATLALATVATAPPASAANTTTLAVTAPASVAVGTPVSANATLAGATTTPAATGQIGFAVFPGHCGSSGPGTPVPPPDNVTANGVYSSAAYTPNTPGNFSWAAFYTGDTNNSSAVSSCASFTVTPATSSKASPTLTTATTPPATVLIGSTISDSATLAGGNNPTGQIGFAVFPSANCLASGPGVAVGSGTPALPANVTNGNGTYNTTAPWTATTAGNYSFAAYYTGDTNNSSATSACEPFTVNGGKAATTLTTTAATTVVHGTPITDTATLTNGNNPTGAIGFTVFPSFNCLASGPGTPVPQPVTVTGNGSYTSATYTPTTAGSYSWAAFYTGDTNNSSSTSTCEPFTVT
jgi:hypothetical protein